MSYIAVPGYIVIDGYQPDGDTVRFIADETRIFLDLPRARSDAFGKASPHRTLFRAIAEDARKAGVGVWAKDRSNAGFPVRSDSSLGPHGALVFPKIFRRSVAFFREHAPSESFEEWLKLKSGVDDEVRASEGGWRRLSDLIDERDGVLRLIDDPTSLVFAEA